MVSSPCFLQRSSRDRFSGSSYLPVSSRKDVGRVCREYLRVL